MLNMLSFTGKHMSIKEIKKHKYFQVLRVQSLIIIMKSISMTTIAKNLMVFHLFLKAHSNPIEFN